MSYRNGIGPSLRLGRPWCIAVLALVGAACSSKPTGTTPSGGSNACSSDKFGCVTVKAGDPIHFGAIQTVSGSTSALGTDEVHGINLGHLWEQAPQLRLR